MKTTSIILAITLTIVILLNIFLLVLYKKQASLIEIQTSQLSLGENANETLSNKNSDLLFFQEKSFLVSPFIVFDKIVYNKLQTTTKDGVKLFVHIDTDYCAPCINKLSVLLKDIARDTSPEKIVILTTASSKKELTILQNMIGTEYSYVQITPESIHLHHSENLSVPYLFFWEHGNKYPILFMFYYKELIDFNEKYKDAAISYLNR